MPKPIKFLFWDFNGTILDDCAYAVDVRNRTFPAFGLPTIDRKEDYQKAFCFPVRKYYEEAGVTDDNFDAVAHAWMDEYVRGSERIPLHEGIVEALASFQKMGLTQVLLSASERTILQNQLAFYDLLPYFKDVLGLSDIYATSKEAIGRTYMEKNQLDPSACLMLGDTLHDAQVAKAMGIDCILIANGHQNLETLARAGVPVVDDLQSAVDCIVRELV